MDIKNVTLFIPDNQSQAMGGKPTFKVTLNDDSESVGIDVPLDKLNRHYWEIKEWYDRQKVKPFKYSFYQSI